MYRVVLAGLLLLAAPMLALAMDAPGAEHLLALNVPSWPQANSFISLVLLVFIVFQLVMVRSDLSRLMEKMGVSNPGEGGR